MHVAKVQISRYKAGEQKNANNIAEQNLLSSSFRKGLLFIKMQIEVG